MKSLTVRMILAGALALLALTPTLAPVARAADGASPFEVSVLGGVQALNQNDTALPDHFLNVPATATVGYRLDPTWALEGEVSWLIPIKRSVDLGGGSSQDLKTPDILTYQANVRANLPVGGGPWSPYLTGGAGAVTFLSSTDPDRYPQLSSSQTAFAINFGAGTHYALGPHWALRADYRELGAFPSKDAEGLSKNSKADPIWMERGALGLAYRF